DGRGDRNANRRECHRWQLAPSDRGQNRDYIVFGHRRLEAAQITHVFIVEVDVDERPLCARGLEQMAGEARVASIDVGDQLTEGRPLGGNTALAANARPK